jgi:hypothetical protein
LIFPAASYLLAVFFGNLDGNPQFLVPKPGMMGSYIPHIYIGNNKGEGPCFQPSKKYHFDGYRKQGNKMNYRIL